MSHRVVHLELHTADPSGAEAFYAGVCGWRPERVEAGGGSYVAMDLGSHLGGGIVRAPTPAALWVPYVAVRDIAATTEQARRDGAEVLLEPREGVAGWRSIIAAPAAGAIALFQPRTCPTGRPCTSHRPPGWQHRRA